MSQTAEASITAVRQSIFTADVIQILAATLVVYDFVILLDQEIQFIWLRPKSRWSILYFLSRYGGLLCFVFPCLLPSQSYATSPTICYLYNEFHIVLFDCLVFVIILTLQLRVSVMYVGTAFKRVVFATWIFAAVHASVIIACAAGFFAIDRYRIQGVDSQTKICFLTTDMHVYTFLNSLDEGTRVAHAALPLLLAVYKAWIRYRETRQLKVDGIMNFEADNPVTVTNGVIKVLMRDTVIYVVGGFVVINILGWTHDANIQSVTVALEAASCVLVSRMIINLKSTYDDLSAQLVGKSHVSELVFVRRNTVLEPHGDEDTSAESDSG